MVAVRIDDPVDAIAVHGAGGIVGILSLPIFMEVMLNGSFRKTNHASSCQKCARLFEGFVGTVVTRHVNFRSDLTIGPFGQMTWLHISLVHPFDCTLKHLYCQCSSFKGWVLWRLLRYSNGGSSNQCYGCRVRLADAWLKLSSGWLLPTILSSVLSFLGLFAWQEGWGRIR